MAIPPIPHLPTVDERIAIIHTLAKFPVDLPHHAIDPALTIIFSADPLYALARGAILALVQEKEDLKWDYEVLTEWLARIHDELLREIYENGVADGIACAKRKPRPQWKDAATFKTVQALKRPGGRQYKGG